jgi:hypothetical protein
MIMGGWGDAFAQAYQSASAAAKSAADLALSSAQEAGKLVVKAASATVDGVQTAGKAAANVLGFGARAAGETATAVGKAGAAVLDKAIEAIPVVGALYKAAKNTLSPSQPPRKRVVEPCVNTIEAKKERLEKRQSLIKDGQQPGSSAAQKAAAQRLAKNNDAVELARLSEDTYAQYKKPPINKPPLGWNAMSPDELKKSGIDPKLLADSKAVIYQTPEDWPGGQKTVLAFRGTEPSEVEDLKTNLDQALGAETVQYNAAVKLGSSVSTKLGPSTLVTGHSLGGGKAQAAGVKGGLSGTMFNSAGLNDETVSGLAATANQFQQFRAPGDPLTMLQNSAALQSGVGLLAGGVAMPAGLATGVGNFVAKALGLPGLSSEISEAAGKAASAFPKALGNLATQGTLLPVAKGKITEAPSLDDSGKPVPATDLLGQHSVHNLVNGIESQKSEDIATLEGA